MLKKLCAGIVVILAVLAISVPSFAQQDYEVVKFPCNFCSWGFTKNHQNLDVDISHNGGVTKTEIAASQKMVTGTYTHTSTYTHTPKYWGFWQRKWFRFPIDVAFGWDCEYVSNYQYQEWSGNGITIKQQQWAFANAQSRSSSYSSSFSSSCIHALGLSHSRSRSCSYSTGGGLR